MAKIGFTKLGLKPINDIQIIEFNEQNIEVKQYLPIQKKLELITKVVEMSHEDSNFANPVKISVHLALNIIEYYTNINLTEKQKEDVPKLYDLIKQNGLLNMVIENIPNEEYQELCEGVYKTIKSIYKYRNSILGILETISQDYSEINLNIDEIQNKLNDPESLALLKEITKLV